MADKKITELNALTTPVGEDLFAIVDIDANETKKTTYADLTSSLQEDIFNQNTGSFLVNSTFSNSFISFDKGDGTSFTLPEPLLSREETGSFFKSASLSSEWGQDINTQRLLFELGNEVTTSVDMADFLVRGQSGSFFKSASISYGENTQLHLLRGNETSESINLNFITPSETGSLVNTTYGLFNQTGSYTGVSASIDESSLIGGGVGTLSVPANGFRQGDAYQATFSGTCLFHNGDTLRLRVKADGILLADTGIITLTRADAERWNLTIDFSIHQIGAAGVASLVSTGIFQYTQHASSNFSGRNFGFTNNTTFDTTIDNQLEVTGQFNHNDNVISTDIFTLRKVY